MRYGWKDLFFGTTSLAGAALGVFLMFGATSVLRADDHDCQRRIVNADHKLDKAVARHGYQSRQAENARRELHEAREHCWSTNHRWWDEHDHRWHTERDWYDR